MTDAPDLGDLAGEEFVSLTTFRRSGTPVAVPVWIAPGPDGDGALLITTVDGSGKVKRIRHDARVTLRPCARRGEVAPGAPTVDARAEIVEDPADVRRLRTAIRDKYGSRMRVTAADDPGAATDDDEPRRVILRLSART